MQDFFHTIDLDNLVGKTILLDIDGTLVADGQIYIDERTISKVKTLAEKNSVILVSNKKIHARNNELAKLLEVEMLTTPLKKPNKKIVELIAEHHPKNKVVIGDKYLTDGIFAKRIGAEFIKVKRIRSKKDSLSSKISYSIDDLAHFLSRLF